MLDNDRNIRIWLKINPCNELLEREAKDIYLSTVSPHRNFDLSRYQLVGARYQRCDISSWRLEDKSESTFGILFSSFKELGPDRLMYLVFDLMILCEVFLWLSSR